jgi:type I restriction enzyme S subunit
MTYIVLKTLVDFEVPVPSLEVQHEIVSILDKFTQLEAELEAELDARRSQYEHTRDQLLDFSGDLSSHPLRELIAELCPEGVQFYKMADVLQRKKGAPVTAQSMKSLPKGDGSVRVFAGGRTLVDVDSGALAENLVISGPGIIVKSRGIIEFAFWEGLFSHKNELWSYVAKSRKLDLKFAYFYLLTKTEEFRSLARSKSVKMPQLATPDTDEYRIPIPPLEVQHEIVSILDKLDALVNDLTFGLPAEITARRKQYEYYRNQLLTFKELETA